jgi:hypothetical protein
MHKKKLWFIPMVALSLLILAGCLSCVKEEPAPMSELGAKELQAATEVVGSAIPLPSYLPPGYKTQQVRPPEKGPYFGEREPVYEPFWLDILISDREIKGSWWEIEAQWVPDRHCIGLRIVLWAGHPLPSYAYDDFPPPERGEHFDGIKGHFWQISDDSGRDAWWVQWCLPNWDNPECLLNMGAWVEVPKEELIKIAKSIKLPK